MTTAQPGTVEEEIVRRPPRSFMEVQLPVSRLSKESYKERTAAAGQTLTGLGKWWGRKPLVLVRACVLGLLLPATDDPEADREAFLALLTMDDDGLERRRDRAPSASDAFELATPAERDLYFTVEGGKPKWADRWSRDERRRFETLAFKRMGYDTKLRYCARPEEIDGPSLEAWERINRHLGTKASKLAELIVELGERRFGHIPRVGDAFCGGGSVPFEAARLGCEAYGSDLSPVAALLTWGAIHIVGGGTEAVERVRAAQQRSFAQVQATVDEWGIEQNSSGWVADAYLYCSEVRDPATGWLVPLAPSWVIAPKTNVVAHLVPERAGKRFAIEVREGVSATELERAANEGTAVTGVRSPVDRDGAWLPPEQRQATSLEQLRGREGLRLWSAEDLVPRESDVYQERLYCVRWVDPKTGERHYMAPTAEDLDREQRVLTLLRERFDEWQKRGYIPSRRIEPGAKTNELLRTRGWTYWHHLFNPRQLLLNGLLAEAAAGEGDFESRALLLKIGRLVDWNSRLSRWLPPQGGGIGGGTNTFYNQALNPLNNYSCRPLATLQETWCSSVNASPVTDLAIVEARDARSVSWSGDIWITDPGYADAINYEELSELFLAWYEKAIPRLFPDWYADSKRALAVAGRGLTFRQAMVECYSHLTSIMSDDGVQIVMFTHQDAEVWADVALVLWAAGLHVSAAWTIATEKGSGGLKQGNYVQGTVLLVLRKRQGGKTGDLSDLYPEIRAEVQDQLQEMLALDPTDEPNFDDADYQLAAYAAALRVMTGYESIAEVDVERELRRERQKGEAPSPLAQLIESAVKIASDYLVPDGLDGAVWKRLTPEERLYLKGVEVESHGEYRDGVYQEFARGLGVREYRTLLASGTANQTRLKTPSELKGQHLGGEGFAGSLLRAVLFAVFVTDRDRHPRDARQYLKQELPGYWDQRQMIIQLLRFLGSKPPGSMKHWAGDVAAAQLLAGAVENDSV